MPNSVLLHRIVVVVHDLILIIYRRLDASIFGMILSLICSLLFKIL